MMISAVHTRAALAALLLTFAAVAIAQPQPTGGGSRYTGEHFASRSPVLGLHGMAATSHPLASLVAVETLKKGGSAVDAAIAANAMLGLVEPHYCGIGGDLFAIVWDPRKKRLEGYNGSGRSPQSLSFEELAGRLEDKSHLPLFGGLSVSVPGAVDGWYALHERFGRLPMNEVLGPAIRYAREGIAVTEVDAALWADALKQLESSDLSKDDLAGLEATFRVNGRPPQAGDVFRNPDLADSYSTVANGGREGFYQGELARRIVSAVRDAGGALALEDLESHRGEWVSPMSVRYRGYEVYELPPNGQGITALQILALLEPYPLGKLGRDNPDFWHLMIEATKLAYEDRAKYYSDPAFGDGDYAWLLSQPYIDKRRKLIDMHAAAQSLQAGAPPPHGDTTYLAVADEDGMMVSFIQSNYWEFGSGLVPEGAGFPLQNRGSSFSMDRNHANAYAPGKRPFHTIIPAMLVKDGAPVMAFGVMGGFLQPQGHVQILVNMLDLGMNVQEAGDAARFVHSSESQPTGGHMTGGGSVLMEAGVSPEVVEALRRRGHHIEYGAHPYIGSVGGYEAVWRDPETGVYQGATEMRFDGAAVGY